MKGVATLVGVSEKYLIKGITGKLPNDWNSQQIHKRLVVCELTCDQFDNILSGRFYTAMALYELVNEVPILEVSAKFKIPRGVLHGLQQIASSFAGIVTNFCKSLQWHLLALILDQFQERLYFGIHPDLIELMKIPSMNSRIARAFFKNGIQKLSKLASTKKSFVDTILNDLGENFFVMGKSLKCSTDELADLLISDARHHIKGELGLHDLAWNDSRSVDLQTERQVSTSCDEKDSGESKKKRKATTPLTVGSNKKSFVRPDPSGYKRKLRSSRDLSEDFRLLPDSHNATTDGFTTIKTSKSSTDLPFCIVDITDYKSKEFEDFKKELLMQTEIGLSFGVNTMKSTKIIGPKTIQAENLHQPFLFDEAFKIECICLSFSKNQVTCLHLQHSDKEEAKKIEEVLQNLFSESLMKINIYEARDHLKILAKVMDLKVDASKKIQDPRLASWIIDPDSDLNWAEMVAKVSPENTAVLDLAASKSVSRSLGLNHNSKVEPRLRSAIESLLVNELIHSQLKVMNEQVSKVYFTLEMPIQKLLVKMELAGFPICGTKLESLIEKSTQSLRQLEQHIFDLNGRKFNLCSSKEVAKVVGIHKSKKQKLYTAKTVLGKLETPIAKYIMLWRTLTKTISNIQPMTSLLKSKHQSRIHCSSFSLTQTGRISMYEPNLQNVTKEFVINFQGKPQRNLLILV